MFRTPGVELGYAHGVLGSTYLALMFPQSVFKYYTHLSRHARETADCQQQVLQCAILGERRREPSGLFLFYSISISDSHSFHPLLLFDPRCCTNPSFTQVREARLFAEGRLPLSHVPPQVKDLLYSLGPLKILFSTVHYCISHIMCGNIEYWLSHIFFIGGIISVSNISVRSRNRHGKSGSFFVRQRLWRTPTNTEGRPAVGKYVFSVHERQSLSSTRVQPEKVEILESVSTTPIPERVATPVNVAAGRRRSIAKILEVGRFEMATKTGKDISLSFMLYRGRMQEEP